MLKKVSSYFITMFFNVLKRFPLASLSLFLSFIFLVLSNHLIFFDYRNDFARAAAQAFIAFPLMTAIQLFSENYMQKRTALYKLLLNIFAIAFNIIYFFYFFTNWEKIEVIRCIALFITFTLAAMILLSYKNKNFSINLIKLSTTFFLSCLYAFVLMFGLIGFFLITQILLFPDLDSDIIPDIITFSYIVFAPIFFMSGIPDRHSNNDELKYPLILKFIVKYLAIPFSFGYMTILYLYFAKTLISHSIPKGIIVHIVIWFSIGCFIVLAYISALLKESKSTLLYNKIIPKLSIPILMFMFYSLYLRVRDYGFTESRYFILITGVFLLGFMIYASFTKNIKWKALLSILIILTLISVFSPLSAFTVSKWSQNIRFEKILKRNNMILKGNIVPSYKISEKDKSELHSIFDYFHYPHSKEDLRILPKNLKSDDYEKVFGFNISSYYFNSEDDTVYLNYHNSESNNFIMDSSDYDLVVLFDYTYNVKDSTVENNKYKAVYESNKKSVLLYSKESNSLIYSFDLNKAIAFKLKENREKGTHSYSTPDNGITYTDSSSKILSATYRFNNISGKYSKSTNKYINLDFSGILLRIKFNK